ncbi:MAG: hypothetical protein RL318_1734, partial [Fibrobacterota bacterium]
QELDQLAEKLISRLPLDKPTLAVLPLEGEEGKAISEYLVANYQASGMVTVVERAQFNKLLQEQALSLSGAVSDSAAVKAGKALSARFLVTGSVGKVLGTQRVNLRILDVETGKVLQAGSFSAKGEEFAGLPKELLGEQGKVSSAVFRSAAIPGWGQFYTDHPVRGSLALGAFAASAGFVTWSFIQANNHAEDLVDLKNTSATNSGKKALKDQFTAEYGVFDQESYNAWIAGKEDALAKKRDDDALRGTIGLGVLAGVYALNLVDAALCGSQSKRAFELYFSGTVQNPSATLAVAW